jgi:hypothetical protein
VADYRDSSLYPFRSSLSMSGAEADSLCKESELDEAQINIFEKQK